MFVEAFVSELTIETLHVGILDGFPGFDETLLHPGALRPLEQGDGFTDENGPDSDSMRPWHGQLSYGLRMLFGTQVPVGWDTT